jgi:hypothetical protein
LTNCKNAAARLLANDRIIKEKMHEFNIHYLHNYSQIDS